MLIYEENFRQHLEALNSELFKCSLGGYETNKKNLIKAC